MEGAKALALDAFAEKRGIAMLRLDYSGTGSSGGEFEDSTLAARQAIRSLIGLVMERGYTWAQAYSICSVAADLRISEIVDVPNPVVSAVLPIAIFEG